MKKWVFGFDLSLKAPACVALPLDWCPGDWKAVKTFTLCTTDPASKDDVVGQYRRYAHISNWALECLEVTVRAALPHTRDHVAGVYIEQYAFSKNNANASKIYENGGICKFRLYNETEVLPQVVNTSQARVVLLGTIAGIPKGGQKIAVESALCNRGGAPRHWTEDQYDAAVVANFGLSELGGTALMLHGPTPAKKKNRKA